MSLNKKLIREQNAAISRLPASQRGATIKGLAMMARQQSNAQYGVQFRGESQRPIIR